MTTQRAEAEPGPSSRSVDLSDIHIGTNILVSLRTWLILRGQRSALDQNVFLRLTSWRRCRFSVH